MSYSKVEKEIGLKINDSKIEKEVELKINDSELKLFPHPKQKPFLASSLLAIKSMTSRSLK